MLVIGAGSGNDVAVALPTARSTSTPSRSTRGCCELGRSTTPTTRTRTRGSTTHVDDGRAFLESTDRKYDLICSRCPTR